jgi:hypothetical protein
MQFAVTLPATDNRARGAVFEDYDLGDDYRIVDGILTTPDGQKLACANRLPETQDQLGLRAAAPERVDRDHQVGLGRIRRRFDGEVHGRSRERRLRVGPVPADSHDGAVRPDRAGASRRHG